MGPVLKSPHPRHLPFLMPFTGPWVPSSLLSCPCLSPPGPGPRLEPMVVCASSTHLAQGRAGLLDSVWAPSTAPSSSAHSWRASHCAALWGPAQPRGQDCQGSNPLGG